MKFLSKLILIMMLVCCTGCGLNTPAQKPQDQSQEKQTKQEIKFDPQLAGNIKKEAKAVNGVQDSTVVVMNEEISAAIKVTGFDRLKLKSIKEKVHQKIKEANKGYTVRITSDKKLFSQLQKIEKQVQASPQKTPSEVQQQLQKINLDM